MFKRQFVKSVLFLAFALVLPALVPASSAAQTWPSLRQ